MRWPPYFIEALLNIVALGLTVWSMARRVSGWRENWFPFFASVFGLLVAGWMSFQVIQAGWIDLPLSTVNAIASGAVLVIWPLNVCLIMGVRLWQNRG